MSLQEIEKLLGGYATDTLSEEERRTLFEAALGNQALFDALADEQALRELLQDPPSRAHLLEALREERPSLAARIAAWFRQPPVLALVAAAAAGIVTIAIVIPRYKTAEKPAAVALNTAPQQPQPEMVDSMQRELERKAATPAPAGSTPVAATAPARLASPAPAEPAPAGSPRTATKDKERRDQLLETDAVMKRRESAKPVEPLAAATTPAPPPPPVVATAQPQFKSADENKVQVQAQSPQIADAAAPRQIAGAAGAQLGDRKKETAAAGARALYYASQPAVSGGFLAQPRNAPSKTGGGRALTLRSPAVPPPAPAIGGVRYTLQRRNLDGSFVDVEPGATLVPGDTVRVRFETNLAGNLSIMERQPDGVWTVRLATRSQAGEAVYMPAEGTINVTAPGAMHFFVRFSRSLRADARFDQAAATSGLVRETAATSVYVVNPVAAADPLVDFEFAINVR